MKEHLLEDASFKLTLLRCVSKSCVIFTSLNVVCIEFSDGVGNVGIALRTPVTGLNFTSPAKVVVVVSASLLETMTEHFWM